MGCLIPIYITIDVVDYLGDCYVCGEPIELGQIGVLDWQRRLLLHPIERKSEQLCIELYQTQYLIDHPNTTNTQLMIMFGISNSTARRRRNGTK